MDYTGKERDTETGLDYFGARYFSGVQGRFTSADPLLASGRTAIPQSWNRYAYVLNNPFVYIDPDGRQERRSNISRLIDNAGSVVRVRVAAGVGGKATFAMPTFRTEAGASGLVNLKFAPLNLPKTSLSATGDLGGKVTWGKGTQASLGGQIKKEAFLIKDGSLDPHVEDKSTIGPSGKNDATGSRASAAATEFTLLAVGGTSMAGRVPVVGEGELSIDMVSFAGAVDAFPGALNDVSDVVSGILNSVREKLSSMLPKPDPDSGEVQR